MCNLGETVKFCRLDPAMSTHHMFREGPNSYGEKKKKKKKGEKKKRKKSRLIEKREKVGVSRYEKKTERKKERERNWVSGVGWA